MSILIAFVLAIFSIYILQPIAKHIKLIDSPGGRKNHTGDIPLIGGIGMFLGFILALLAIGYPLHDFRIYFACSIILILVGLLDDLHELSPKARLFSQFLAALLMTMWAHNNVVTLGNIFFFGDINLGIFSIFFTLIATVGIINAINMTDGVDGLAGSMVLVELILMAILAYLDAKQTSFGLLVLLATVLFAYLCWNFPMPFVRTHARVFMGDAGSMFLGFSLAWFLVSLSQGDHPAARPVTMLWIMCVPLFDTVRVIFHRISKKSSPFMPGRDHIHHLLADSGFSSFQITVILASSSLILGLVGIIAGVLYIPEGVMFLLYLILFAVFYQKSNHAWKRLQTTATLTPQIP